MTCREKLKMEHPEKVSSSQIGGCLGCPSTYGYLPYPEGGCVGKNCNECWDREIPEDRSNFVIFKDGHKEKILKYNAPSPKFIEFITESGYYRYQEDVDIHVFTKRDVCGNYTVTEDVDYITWKDDIFAEPEVEEGSEYWSGRTVGTIKDSGDRTEFETGAVRDCHEGKGRCDLMPLDVIADIYGTFFPENSDTGKLLGHINEFMMTGEVFHLKLALDKFERYKSYADLFLEVAVHFEEGCKKYGEDNWRKGIPAKRYIDSAVRHYLKWLRGDKDERHDRAFCWNILCCIWTCNHKPELNDYRKEVEE